MRSRYHCNVPKKNFGLKPEKLNAENGKNAKTPKP